ncbi:MAG: TVP38/TMEM64 family protein [Citrobacter sp.]
MLIVALLLCVLVGVFHYSGLSGLITHFQHLQDLIRQSGMFGYALYILLFIVAALCLIPGSVLVIVGGILFGPVMGTLVSLFAATVASALSFLLARWLGRDLLLKYVGHTTIFQAIEKGIAQSGIDFLIFTRLVPLFPYNIQNYAYGLTTISFWSFTVISAVTTLPGLFIYTLMSHELASKGITLAFMVKLSIAGFILFALVQAAKAWARVKRIVPSTNGELADKS